MSSPDITCRVCNLVCSDNDYYQFTCCRGYTHLGCAQVFDDVDIGVLCPICRKNIQTGEPIIPRTSTPTPSTQPVPVKIRRAIKKPPPVIIPAPTPISGPDPFGPLRYDSSPRPTLITPDLPISPILRDVTPEISDYSDEEDGKYNEPLPLPPPPPVEISDDERYYDTLYPSSVPVPVSAKVSVVQRLFSNTTKPPNFSDNLHKLVAGTVGNFMIETIKYNGETIKEKYDIVINYIRAVNLQQLIYNGLLLGYSRFSVVSGEILDQFPETYIDGIIDELNGIVDDYGYGGLIIEATDTSVNLIVDLTTYLPAAFETKLRTYYDMSLNID